MTLLLCLLFTSIELLQNNIDQALFHLRGGIRIAATLTPDSQDDRSTACLIQALGRFQVQARVHSSPTSDFNRNTVDIRLLGNASELPQSLRDMNEARLHLDRIAISTYTILRRVKHLTRSSKIPLSSAKSVSFENALTSLASRLSRWREAFHELRDHLCGRCNNQTTAAPCLLELQSTSQFIILHNVFDPGEMCYDECTPDFVRIVNLAKEFLRLRLRLDYIPISIDSGLISPLFLVALKCRVPAVRVSAIDLLRLCPRREGLWHRDSVLQIVNWKLMREGKDCTETAQHGTIPQAARIHSEQQSGA